MVVVMMMAMPVSMPMPMSVTMTMTVTMARSASFLYLTRSLEPGCGICTVGRAHAAVVKVSNTIAPAKANFFILIVSFPQRNGTG
jgi:hypothetical protein